MDQLFQHLVAALLSGSLALGAGHAPPPESAPPTVRDVAVAAPRAGGERARTDDGVALGEDGEDPSLLETPQGRLTLRLPGVGAATSHNPTTRVFEARRRGATVAAQSLQDGLRALVVLDSPSAPERFAFEVGGDVAALELTDDGGVVALDDRGAVIATSPRPWARDAAGASVPTHYEVDGTTLTQVVEHRHGSWAYRIVADPSFWSVLKCVGAITWVLATSVLVVAKLVKIRLAVRALGGIWETAQLLLRATSWSEKLHVLASAGTSAAVSFFGIDRIRQYC